MRPRFANRGSREFARFQTTSLRASMRPRFANRGSSACSTRAGRLPGRFNEAPIRESGKFGFRHLNIGEIPRLQ